MALFIYAASSIKSPPCMSSFDWLTCTWTMLDNVEKEGRMRYVLHFINSTSFWFGFGVFSAQSAAVSNTVNGPRVKTDFSRWTLLKSISQKKTISLQTFQHFKSISMC